MHCANVEHLTARLESHILETRAASERRSEVEATLLAAAHDLAQNMCKVSTTVAHLAQVAEK